MRYIALCLFCLIPLFAAPAAAEYPQEFREAHKEYVELMKQGKVSQALPHARKALEIARQSDAFDDGARGKLAFNLGYALYMDLQLSASVEAFGQAIEFFDRAGGHRRLKATAFVYRGLSYQTLVRFDDAQAELEQALELSAGTDRGDRLIRADALEALTWVAIARRRYFQADDYAAESYSILKELLGEHHPRTLYSLLALSAANYKQGRGSEARDQLAHALELADKVSMAEPGAEPGPMQFTRQGLIRLHERAALLYRVMKRPEDAEYHREIVADLRKGMPPPNLRVTPDKRKAPAYPLRARWRGVTGWVLVEYTVRPDGSTADLRIVDSAPQGYFERAVIRAVDEWTFKPPLEDGEPVEVKKVRTMIQFRLKR